MTSAEDDADWKGMVTAATRACHILADLAKGGHGLPRAMQGLELTTCMMFMAVIEPGNDDAAIGTLAAHLRQQLPIIRQELAPLTAALAADAQRAH